MADLLLFTGLLHEPDEYVEKCIACDVPLKDGDLVHSDVGGGCLHAACCGPERECFVGEDEEPLKDGEPIPEPWPWYRDPRNGP